MSGTANICDNFKPGDPCIIKVDSVNSPEGLWWGEIIDVQAHGNYLSVEAKITGGRVVFANSYPMNPIHSDENSGKIPHVNYIVYPSTTTTNDLFRSFLYEKEQLKNRVATLETIISELKSLYRDICRK